MPFDFDRFSRRLEEFEYADAALRRTAYSAVGVKDREVDFAKEGVEESLSLRIFHRGAFGFAATNRLDKAGEALARAEKLAKARSGKTRLARPEVHAAKSMLRPKKHAADYSMGQKIGWLKEFSALAKRKRVFRVQASFASSSNDKLFANSEGARVKAVEPRIVCGVQAFAREGGRTESAFHQIKCRAGVEALGEMRSKAEQAGSEAVMLLRARHSPKGKMTAVLDPELAGVMAHEAVGHACEADEVQAGGSILAGKLGEKIGGEAVVIRDSPLLGPRLWGCYDYDDEGTKAKGAILVKNGALQGFLSSLETAGVNRGILSGNGRAEPGRRPIVRMSNTFFDKGSSSVSELFSGIRRGVYLVGCKEGQVSPKSGNFTFAAKYGYLIKNGEKAALIKDCSINGNILEALHNVASVAKDLDFVPGTCGKEGQGVPVTTGSPHLLIRDILVG